MAAVYEAHESSLDRRVALKVLPAEFLYDPAFADRFRQEARVAAKLEHPHIVPIHAYGIEEGRPWMAMRLVTGGSLAERVRRSPLSPAETAAVLRDVAAALDYAHARGVVHRDVKPANVLLDETGRAYLADFGIARMLEGSSVATATGLIQGTPSYMAPEQAMGVKVDRLADVYALGVVAFECLTGRVPYTGTTPVAILMKQVQEPVPEPTAAEMAPALTAVLRRCLAKTPSA
jgi:serine/threonine-protein kinase